VLDGEISGRVLAVSPISGEGCHNHSVLESDCADLDGLKKLGCGHCNASVCFRDLLGGVVPVKSSIVESSFIQQFTTITGCHWQDDGIDREARDDAVGMTNYTQLAQPGPTGHDDCAVSG
jgi:hypothetical protein